MAERTTRRKLYKRLRRMGLSPVEAIQVAFQAYRDYQRPERELQDWLRDQTGQVGSTPWVPKS